MPFVDYCNDTDNGASDIDDILDDGDSASPLQISDSINLCHLDKDFDLTDGKI